MLKQNAFEDTPISVLAATFGWLCVETQIETAAKYAQAKQPPSGGCVLKLYHQGELSLVLDAAAFGRLCVET